MEGRGMKPPAGRHLLTDVRLISSLLAVSCLHMWLSSFNKPAHCIK